MVKMYCRKKHKHKKELCSECKELMDYVEFRIDKCPFKANKPFCNTCRVHCYNPDMQERIKNVMRFAGPRLIFTHPLTAIKHARSTIKHKKKLRKEATAKAKAMANEQKLGEDKND